MKKEIFLLFVIASMISSCQTLENLSPRDYKVQELNEDNLTLLNGSYKNYEDTLFGKMYSSLNPDIISSSFLTDRLFLILPDLPYTDSTFVELKYTSLHKCEIKVFNENDLIYDKTLRGKIKNGYFLTRPKFWILPFFPLIFGANFERIRIAKIENGLIIDHKINMWAMFFIAGGSTKGKVSAIYLLNDK